MGNKRDSRVRSQCEATRRPYPPAPKPREPSDGDISIGKPSVIIKFYPKNYPKTSTTNPLPSCENTRLGTRGGGAGALREAPVSPPGRAVREPPLRPSDPNDDAPSSPFDTRLRRCSGRGEAGGAAQGEAAARISPHFASWARRRRVAGSPSDTVGRPFPKNGRIPVK